MDKIDDHKLPSSIGLVKTKKRIALSLPAATLKMYILIHQLLLFKNIHYSETGDSTFTFCNVRMGYFDFNTFGLLLK